MTTILFFLKILLSAFIKTTVGKLILAGAPIAAVAAKGAGGAAASGGAGGAAAGGGGGGMMKGMMGKGGGGGGGMGSAFSNFRNNDKGLNAPAKWFGMALGATQMLGGMKSKKRAESAFPSLIDPTQAAFLSELNQKRKSIDTGAEFAAPMAYAEHTGAGTDTNIVRATGGDAQSTIAGLLASQAGTNQAKNQILGQGQNQQMQYTGMAGDLTTRMADRKTQLQLARYQQNLAEWAQKAKEGKQNLVTGLAKMFTQTSNMKAPDTNQYANQGNVPTANKGGVPAGISDAGKGGAPSNISDAGKGGSGGAPISDAGKGMDAKKLLSTIGKK